MESTSEKKRRYPTMESNAIARKAKREIRLTGHTEIACPYCGTAPVITKHFSGGKAHDFSTGHLW